MISFVALQMDGFMRKASSPAANTVKPVANNNVNIFWPFHCSEIRVCAASNHKSSAMLPQTPPFPRS